MIIAFLALMTQAHGAEFGVGAYGGDWALPAASALPPDVMLGGRLRYRWSERFGAEVSAGKASVGLDPRAEFLAFMPNKSRLTPFGAIGGGAWVGDRSAMWLGDVGGGVDAELVPWLDFRTDVRLRVLGESKPTAALLFNVGLQLHTLRVQDGDGDGIVDRFDACKDSPEDRDSFEDQDGCPDLDNDGDGLADTADRCPIEAEDADAFEDGDGCVDPDNDGDSVLDGADACPSEAEDKDGFEDSDGCRERDNDKDGIDDGADTCVNEPETINGFSDQDGCADEVPAEVQKFSGVIDGVNFESGKAILLPGSRSILDAAGAVMTKFPDLRFEVQGHTDDQGDDSKNLALSQARAQAVVDYLVAKGVSADRLVPKGYGETAPKVANDNKTNRATNRRVEFKRL